MDGPYLFNAFELAFSHDARQRCPATRSDAGSRRRLVVGLGSVGTAVLYFLTLLTNRFSAALFDMDFVKVENLDRSPIFVASDSAEEKRLSKVNAAEKYLCAVGVDSVAKEHGPLDQSTRWFARQAGTPDLLISAANKRNVRYIVEQSSPPLQIYGTTGANWVASVIRHIPMVDACSCCLFPPEVSEVATTCATETVIESDTGQKIDASLPFLSFAAGLMGAAEILKAGLPGYPFSPNRTSLYTPPRNAPEVRLFNAAPATRAASAPAAIRQCIAR